MVFSSMVFLCVFLPVVFLMYHLLPGIRAKNILLILASLLFYAYGEPVYILLMVFSTVMNDRFGRWIGSLEGRGRKTLLILAIILNLGLLGVFKYADMAVGTLNAVLGLRLPLPGIRLPIGISFFTFQAMSYVIDVYRKQVEVQKHYRNVLLYVSFFPQLIAGPIVKYHDIEKQIRERSASLPEIGAGFYRFILGLGKKVLVSNCMAVVADGIFALDAGALNLVSAWIGALAYMLQIYYDFSGYSDMAIGMGHMFGFTFQENFRHPYGAVSIRDFWRRWHISLSTWFRDYLYIPLGGNRKGKIRTAVNRLVVFFTTGLWHGADWTFVAWGLFHGGFSILENWLPVKKFPKVLGHIYMLLVVCVGFVLFRADSLKQGIFFIGAMFTGWQFDRLHMLPAINRITPYFLTVFLIGAIFSFPVAGWFRKRFSKWADSPLWNGLRYGGSLALLFLCMLSLAAGTYNPFIYFRF